MTNVDITLFSRLERNMLSGQELITTLSKELGMLPTQLELVIKTAPLRYKTFTIPKRDGSPRLVAQPAREIKAIQTWLVKDLRDVLPVHSAATAYQQGTSIKVNAAQHLGSKFLLKMDFKNFFPSIQFKDICLHLEKHASRKYEMSAIEMIARLFSWAPSRKPPLRLCIGAPSSPFISNSVLFDFDTHIEQIADADKVSYTRYADDLTFSSSTPNTLWDYPDKVRAALAGLPFPVLTVNENKTVFASGAGLRMITGIKITSDQNLSVGRDRKRLARAMFHHFMLGKLSDKEVEKMLGILAFIDHIEPGFSSRLRSKQPPSAS